MKKHFILTIITFGIFMLMAGLSFALPAFPGAEGFGASTIGGRGGKVIEVTNLNDSGTGSFRAALQASGPRIVIFRTGGTINASSDIEIRNPYITIAGQTAPGDGIALKGGALRIKTHDVIVRNIRVRPGANGAEDGIEIAHGSVPPYNIIIDHCSISWAKDENLSTWATAHDITFQWNILSEGLLHNSGVSYALLLGEHAKRVTISNNLFANNYSRIPLLKGDTTAEVVNNLMYNWGGNGARLKEQTDTAPYTASTSHFIGNYLKAGPNTKSTKAITIDGSNERGSRVYVKDNIGPGRPTNSGDDWLIVNGNSSYRSYSPALPSSGLVADDVAEVHEKTLEYSGAIAPYRDSVDNRVIQDVRNNTGNFISSESEVGGYPKLTSGVAPADTDHDGMPDSWEVAQGLNPNDPSDGNKDKNGDGYTNVENYINGLIPRAEEPSAGTILAPTNLRISS